jgi:hypothetical protein
MKSITALVAGLTLAFGANAGTITSSFSNALEETVIHQTGWLNFFDSNLGELTGVSLNFAGRSETEFVVSNSSSSPQSAQITPSTLLSFGSGLLALDGLMSGANGMLTLSAARTVNLIGNGDDYVFGLQASQDKTWTHQLNAILASFSQTGGGAFSLSCDSEDSLSILGGGGNIGVDERITNAACAATINYTYTARETGLIPEPSGVALLALALGTAAWVNRRSSTRVKA